MNFCLCGAQAGYPHAHDCPFPYFANDPKQVHKWMTWRTLPDAHIFEVKCYHTDNCKEVTVYVSLRKTGRYNADGKYQIEYLMTANSQLIDGGDQYFPTPLIQPVSLESAIHLVEFFDQFTPEASLEEEDEQTEKDA
jgi:hypothetical protein